MKRRQALRSAVAVMLSLTASRLTAQKLGHADGRELIGHPAPPLDLKQWLHSRPLEINDLRGKVVLLRWWTQGCELCTATAPALRKLQSEYADRGLLVIGIYHPKPPGNWDINRVESAAKEKQFSFPVALDGDWTALKRWWLTQDRDFTSVSFLLDRTGIVRYVDPGGEFHEGTLGALTNHESCHRDFHTIETEIVRLLAE